MKALITGHRLFKLQSYDINWIKEALREALYYNHISYGLSGMASGVDIWFCDACNELSIPYSCYIPFEEQKNTMDDFEKAERDSIILMANKVFKNVRNSVMVNDAEIGIVVWDGNKGGTHNVVQQLVEKKKGFIWINPVSKKIWNCL